MDLQENEKVDLKSLRKVHDTKGINNSGIRDLAVSCVAFANRHGGELFIGIEDDSHMPMPGQRISEQLHNDVLDRLKGNCCNVALQSSGILSDKNGDQYFVVTIFPSVHSYASTADGKFYIRVGDKCLPMRSEDFLRLASEKAAYQWETIKTKFSLDSVAPEKIRTLCDNIRASERVKKHVKQMTDIEILDNYVLVDGESLTNLGVLWLGDARQRSRILYPITVQYIVYDAQEQKVRKVDWHDNTLNPRDLILEIENEAIELKYSVEVQNGLFRKQIRQYHPHVIRELLINAFAHKSYTVSGDIIIEVYADRLEISNPGGLPLGVTKDNILHQRMRRNPHLIRLFTDLYYKEGEGYLMEGEGSGYDMIYELNAMDAKQMPLVESDFNFVRVTQYSAIQNQSLIPLFNYVNQNFPNLSQKNLIALGLIAVNEKIAATELIKLLQLNECEKGRLRSYVDTLVDQELVSNPGIGKGTQYHLNPRLIHNAKLNIPTTLKTIEPHALKALVEEDLRRHPYSMLSEIANRLPAVEIKEIQKIIYNMNRKGELKTKGGRSKRQYALA